MAQIQRPEGGADRDNVKVPERGKQRAGEQTVDRAKTGPQNKTGSEVERYQEEEEDGANVGAIVGGIAAAAVVGKLVAGKGGGKDEGRGKGNAAPDKAVEEASPAQIDSDKDGQYTRDEFNVALNKAFKTADGNADGTMTREEAVAAFGDRGGAYFDALDEEKTGSVKMATLESDVARAFEWADANGDGSLTAEERSEAAKELEVAEAEEAEEAKTPKKAGSPKKKLAKKAARRSL
jgi:hypothetical protein